MSWKIAKQTFETKSGDQQGVEIEGGGGKSVQSNYKQEVKGNCST